MIRKVELGVREIFFVVICIFFVSLKIYSAQSPRYIVLEKEMLAVLLLLITIFILSFFNKLQLYHAIMIIIVFIYLAYGFINYLAGVTFILISDVFVYIPIFLTMIQNYKVSLNTDLQDWAVRILLFGGVCASFLAVFFPDNTDFGRFDAPSFFLISICFWQMYYNCKNSLQRIFYFILLATLLWMSLASQWRVSALLSLFILISGVKLRHRLWLGIVLCILVVFGYNADALNFRLLDRSLANLITDMTYYRILEYNAVVESFKDRGSIMSYIFGFGLGAEYYAVSVAAEIGTEYLGTWRWRFDDSYLSDTIHFGPIRIMFKFGLIGVMGYCYLFFTTIKSLLVVQKINIAWAFQIAFFAMLIQSLIHPVETHVEFAMSLLLYYIFTSSRLKEGP